MGLRQEKRKKERKKRDRHICMEGSSVRKRREGQKHRLSPAEAAGRAHTQQSPPSLGTWAPSHKDKGLSQKAENIVPTGLPLLPGTAPFLTPLRPMEPTCPPCLGPSMLSFLLYHQILARGLRTLSCISSPVSSLPQSHHPLLPASLAIPPSHEVGRPWRARHQYDSSLCPQHHPFRAGLTGSLRRCYLNE